jgi:hypothetical protein
MQYDVFISYASENRGWAEKLETDLVKGNRRVFRDQTRLQAGGRWEAQLQQSLDQSQYLVVLWTNQAQSSNWVHKELARFERHTEVDPRRRLICVNLQGENPAYNVYQAIDSIKAAGVPVDQPDAVNPNLWSDVLSRIVSALDEDEEIERIDTAVLAMTAAEADPAHAGGLAPADLVPIEQNFGLTPADLMKRYGPTRLDWRPYDGQLTIKSGLDQLMAHVNAVVPSKRFGWRSISSDFWEDMTTNKPTEVAAALASARLSLVVVDAVSLLWRDVYRRVMLLREHLNTSTSTWVFVPPVPSDTRTLRYRDLVRGWSAPLLDAYFNPPLPRRDTFTPQLSVYCGDDGEIRRLLQTAIGEYMARSEKGPKSTFTQFRERP